MNHRTIYDTDHTTPLKEGHILREFMNADPMPAEEFRRHISQQISTNVASNLQSGSWDELKSSDNEPQVNPNEILHNMLDHIHDGNREELVGELILMLGWLHKGGTMPNISKDTVTSTTLWIIPND